MDKNFNITRLVLLCILMDKIGAHVRIGVIHALTQDTLYVDRRHRRYVVDTDKGGIIMHMVPIQLSSGSPYQTIQHLKNKICLHNLSGLIYSVDEQNTRQWDIGSVFPGSSYIPKLAESLHIPAVSVTAPLVQEKHGGTDAPGMIYLLPKGRDVCLAILNFLEYFHWYHLTLVPGPNHASVEFVAEMALAIQYRDHWKYNVYDVLDFEKNISHQVEHIALSSSIVIFHMNPMQTRTVLASAAENGLLKKGLVWIISGAALDEQPFSNNTGVIPIGLIGVRPGHISHTSATRTRFAKMLLSEAIADYVNDGNDLRSLSAGPCDKNTNRTWDNVLQPYLNRSVIDIADGFDKDGYLLHPKLAFVNIDDSYNVKQVGTWKKGKIKLKSITWIGQHSNRQGHQPSPVLTQKRLRIITVEETPFVRALSLDTDGCNNGILCKKMNGTYGDFLDRCCGGFAVDLLKELSMTLDNIFEFDFFVVNSYGRFLESGRWNGAVGELVYGKADMMVGGMKMSSQRTEVLDFSVPFMTSGVSVIVMESKGRTPLHAVYDPFHFLVWIMAWIIALAVTALAVFFVEWVSPTGYARKLTEPRASSFTFGDSLWMLWAINTNNSLPTRVPKSVTGKFVTSIWAFYTLVFVALYTANLTAHMIKVESTLPIDGFMDPKLQNPHQSSPRIKFATVQSTNTESLIEDHNPRMHQYMKQYLVKSAAEGIEALNSGDLDVFIYDAMVSEFLATQAHDCNLVTVDSAFAMTGYAIAFPKSSPWRGLIDRALLQYVDNGFLNILREKWISLDSCAAKRTRRSEEDNILGSSQVAGAFLFLAGGIAISWFLMFFELFFYKNLKTWFVSVFRQQEAIALISATFTKIVYPRRDDPGLPTCCEECYAKSLEKHALLEDTYKRIRELENLIDSENWNDSGSSKHQYNGRRDDMAAATRDRDTNIVSSEVMPDDCRVVYQSIGEITNTAAESIDAIETSL
ncbi:glutamate receptor ionotropic, NMDA 2A-like [Saccoglossus kowalevskii]|uniref:Glutamate receptor ionotropic, NMDA 2A-like n=1 Tax=Saccoglossus kowalevskii TaxID=10224 RepID=A0ABM0MSE6_SACKO|nr:PREDICTED: glutamate receptor ionotropic, NMDA 2A-like [Saccoglossus kowalevskii]